MAIEYLDMDATVKFGDSKSKTSRDIIRLPEFVTDNDERLRPTDPRIIGQNALRHYAGPTVNTNLLQKIA